MIKKTRDLFDKFTKEKQKKYIGCIDTVGCELIRGWVSNVNKKGLKEQASIIVNNKKYLVDTLIYREDLDNCGIAKGIAGFELNGCFFNDGDDVFIELKVGDTLVKSKAITCHCHSVKNEDPFFIEQYSNQINRKGSYRIGDGVYIQEITSSHYEKTFCGEYFYRISNSKKNDFKFISEQRISKDLIENDSIEVILNTNTTTQLIVNISDGKGSVISGYRLNIKPGWDRYSYKLSNLDNEVIPRIKKITLEVDIPEGGVLDIGSLTIIEQGVELKLNKPKNKFNQQELGLRNLINNGFYNQKVRTDESLLKNKQEIAHGVFFESKTNDNNVRAKIKDDGLFLNIGELFGYARLSFSIDLKKILMKPMYGIIRYSSSNDACIKSIYIYGRGKQDDIFKSFPIIYKKSISGIEHPIVMPLESVSDFINKTRDYHEFRLAIEFNSNVAINQFSIELNQDQINSDAIHYSIEDEAIRSQIESISGYYDITGSNIYTTNCRTRGKTKYPDDCVDIIIPVFNAKEYFLLCIDSIIKNTSTRHRIILMDDCSTDGVSELIDKLTAKHSHIEAYRNKTNLGYTKNVNSGFDKATAKWVVLLNSDTEVTPYWLESLLEAANSDDKIGIVGPIGNAATWQSIPRIKNENDEWDFNLLPPNLRIEQIAYQVNSKRYDKYPECSVLNGFCQLIKLDAFNKVGKLDQVAFPYGYGEENDLCARMVKAGYKLLICPNSYIYHHKSKSFGHERREELSKKGTETLKIKHPDYDWGLASKKIYNEPVLIELRKEINDLYEIYK